MKTQTSERPSLPAAIGMHCALLSLASGCVGLAVSFILWWRSLPRDIQRIGEQAGMFSAAMGLVLAGIALAAPRKLVHWLGLIALIVNLAILSDVLDKIFMIVH